MHGQKDRWIDRKKERRKRVSEMRVLRKISGVTRRDRMIN